MLVAKPSTGNKCSRWQGDLRREPAFKKLQTKQQAMRSAKVAGTLCEPGRGEARLAKREPTEGRQPPHSQLRSLSWKAPIVAASAAPE